jgi:hypothetical protein
LLDRPEFKAIAHEWDEKSHWLFGNTGREKFSELEQQPMPAASKLFEAGGYGLMRQNGNSLLFDFGPLGYLSLAAHGHADALSLLLTVKGQPILIDPGTYAYREGGDWRRYFRGTAAHNTITINGQDQSEMKGDFLWGKKAVANLLDWQTNPEFDLCTAEHDGYTPMGITHRRTVLFFKPDWVLIEEYLSGDGRHKIEQTWHFPIGAVVKQTAELVSISVHGTAVQMLIDIPEGFGTRIVSGEQQPIQGWISSRYGHKAAAPVLVISGERSVPVRMRTLINLGDERETAELMEKREKLVESISNS